jgi:UDP-N-acetylmuramoyl-L-alanyl-D-glutamate--2,6-diaminopimelate ligase
MLNFFRQILPDRHPIRLMYHKLKAIAAAFRYKFPADKMTIIAVTGTNGKTTTSNIIHRVFMEAGKKAGLLTTVNFKIGEREESNLNKQTTVSPFLLQKKLSEMLRSGCEVVIVEATSIAMVQSRLWGVNVDTAVFTNFTQDHLSYHGSMEDYRDSKGRLFDRLNTAKRKAGVQKISIINADDPEHEYFEQFPVDQMFKYGIQRGAYAARNIVGEPGGTNFLIRIPNGEQQVHFKIPGKFNIYNALAAATVGVAHHINLSTIGAALEKMQPVPGRVESITEGQPYNVIVDYAHSEDALEKLLSMLKELTSGKLITVFGATGGGRDQDKRPKMGAIAHKYSDLIVLTDDDPYEEDSNEIAKMVRGGIPREEGDGFWQIIDRKEAIRLAMSQAKEGDTVVICGKGAEEFQVVGKDRIPHDDRQVAREMLARTINIEVPLA